MAVEDDDRLLVLAGEIHCDTDYTVLDAATPTAALGVAESHPAPIDLLLTDVVMPQMDGMNWPGS